MKSRVSTKVTASACFVELNSMFSTELTSMFLANPSLILPNESLLDAGNNSVAKHRRIFYSSLRLNRVSVPDLGWEMRRVHHRHHCCSGKSCPYSSLPICQSLQGGLRCCSCSPAAGTT
ncbi:hypothetical protein EUGRSUZ_L00942 [Eucalyptus grandis]|uniref:Uncharacterized protein n=1 Tax=Eucalyptus grandis TaxID=71139 RepID=A0A058ZU96_EUCGR|nr:hypothetical protein EUGRSUZ_L00942 [Eucalyptus grandis]